MLSIDLTVQAIIRQVLQNGVSLLNAVGGSVVLLDAHSGEVISLVSLPDFDPNIRGSYSLTAREIPCSIALFRAFTSWDRHSKYLWRLKRLI